jgi:hypothetical protein
MAKAKYVITADDFFHASMYLSDAVRNFRLELLDDMSNETARN